MKKTVMILLATLTLCGCTSNKTIKTIDIIGRWTIESAMGTNTANTDTPAFIQFESNGKMNGNTSVNSFFGNYHLHGDKLTLSNIGMTLMMGPNMEVEDAITQALNSTSCIKIQDCRSYILNSQNDTVMVLKRE